MKLDFTENEFKNKLILHLVDIDDEHHDCGLIEYNEYRGVYEYHSGYDMVSFTIENLKEIISQIKKLEKSLDFKNPIV